MMKTIAHRDMLGWWLNDASLLGEGAEIGSAAGQYAAQILSFWKGKRLHLIDPWTNLSKEEYPEDHHTVDYEQWYAASRRLAETDPRAVLHRMRSCEAAPNFQPNSLDFVYIDGNHNYQHVIEDLDLWYPRIKLGGLLCGHDFYHAVNDAAFCEVDAAVIQWMKDHHLSFTVTPCTSWWCVLCNS